MEHDNLSRMGLVSMQQNTSLFYRISVQVPNVESIFSNISVLMFILSSCQKHVFFRCIIGCFYRMFT